MGGTKSSAIPGRARPPSRCLRKTDAGVYFVGRNFATPWTRPGGMPQETHGEIRTRSAPSKSDRAYAAALLKGGRELLPSARALLDGQGPGATLVLASAASITANRAVTFALAPAFAGPAFRNPIATRRVERLAWQDIG